jgi:hypothetical protein
MRRLYQTLVPLPIGNDLSIGKPDGARIVYPLRGTRQGARVLLPNAFSSQTQRRTPLYVALLATLAVPTVSALVASGYKLVAPLAVVALGSTAAIAERSSVRVARATEQSISVLPTLFAAILFRPTRGSRGWRRVDAPYRRPRTPNGASKGAAGVRVSAPLTGWWQLGV